MNNSRWLKIGAAALTCVMLYALAGWLAGPRLVERQVQRYLAGATPLTAAMQELRFNPFTLTARFENLTLSAEQAPPLLTAERGYADFDLTGIWRGGLNLAELGLERPDASLQVSQRTAAGLAAWLQARTADGRPLHIRRLTVSDGALSVAIPGQRPRELQLDQISFTASGLASGGATGEVVLAAHTPLGGWLRITAQAGLQPLGARGAFEVDRINLEALGRWLNWEGWQPAGTLTVGGQFGGGQQAPFTLLEMSLNGNQIALRPAGGEPLLALDAIRLTGLDLDLRRRRAAAAAIDLDGGALAIDGEPWRDALEALRATGDSWALRAGRVRTRGLTVATTVGGVGWRFADIELDLSNYDSTSEAHAGFTAAMQVNQSARLQASGWLAAATPALQADLKIDGLELAALAANLPPGPELELASGTASAEARLTYRPAGAHFSGQIGIADLLIVDRQNREAVFAAAAAELSGVVIDGPRTSVQVARLDRPELKLTMEPGGRLRPGLPATGEASPLTVQRIEITGGNLEFTDARLNPVLQIRATGVGGTIDAPADPASARAASLKLRGQLSESASADVAATWQPGDSGRQRRIDILLKGVDPPLLAPFATRFAGRGIVSGTLQADLRYLYRGNRFAARQQLLLEDLRLGEHRDLAGAPELPLDLAIALLQDDRGRIEVTAPAVAALDDPDFNLSRIAGQSLLQFLADLEARPFLTLGALVGDPGGDLGLIAFDPGSAAITDESARRLTALSEALERRPAVALRIAGGYSGEADRGALASQQVRLHIALATSAGPPGSGDPGPLAYHDPKVRSVLDEFAGERLAAAPLAALKARHAADLDAYYRAVFEALVANEPIGEPALRKLARYRAQSILGQLSTLGVPAERLQLVDPVAVTGSDADGVPAALAVAVFAGGPSR